MIRHIVLVRLAPGLPDGEWEDLTAGLDGLRAEIPGMLALAALANVSPEEPVIHGFRHGFTVDFADAAARDRYLDHPGHKVLGARLVAACDGGLDGLLVFDHDL